MQKGPQPWHRWATCCMEGSWKFRALPMGCTCFGECPHFQLDPPVPPRSPKRGPFLEEILAQFPWVLFSMALSFLSRVLRLGRASERQLQQLQSCLPSNSGITGGVFGGPPTAGRSMDPYRLGQCWAFCGSPLLGSWLCLSFTRILRCSSPHPNGIQFLGAGHWGLVSVVFLTSVEHPLSRLVLTCAAGECSGTPGPQFDFLVT